MELTIGKYRIRKEDDLNFVVEKHGLIKHSRLSKNENVGKDKWEFVGFYGTLLASISCLQNRSLRDSEATTLSELKEAILATENAIILELSKIIPDGVKK